MGPLVHDGANFLANAPEMRVQSTRSILRVRSDHAPIFTKKRFYVCYVCFPRSSNESASAFRCSKNVFCVGSNRLRPRWCSALLAELTRGKAELLAENALLRHQLFILCRHIKRPVYRKTDRLLLVLLSSMVRTWKQSRFLIQPEMNLALAPGAFPRVLGAPIKGTCENAEALVLDDQLDPGDGCQQSALEGGTHSGGAS
jgi:hypothetical protein